jgi:hypothetical protein
MQFTHDHEKSATRSSATSTSTSTRTSTNGKRPSIFPAHQVFKGLGDLGLLGLTKPEAYGGAGLDYSYGMVMAETLGHINCGGVPMAIGVQTDMCTPALARFGSDELRSASSWHARHRGRHGGLHWRERAGRGQRRGGHQEVARKDGDDYVITGQKMWITNSLQADWMCMLVNTGRRARAQEQEPGDGADARRPQWQADEGHRDRAEDPQDRHEFVSDTGLIYLTKCVCRSATASARRRGLHLPDAAVPGRAPVGGGQLPRHPDRMCARLSNGRSSARCSAPR